MAYVRRRYRETGEFERQVGKALYAYIHISWGSHAMAMLEDHGKSVMIIINLAKDGHSNCKREKAPVQSSHRSSREHGDESPGRKTSIDPPHGDERSVKAAPSLSPPVCRSKETPHHTNHARGSNDKRRKNTRDRTEKGSPRRNIRPSSAASNRPPSEIREFVNDAFGSSSRDSGSGHAVENTMLK